MHIETDIGDIVSCVLEFHAAKDISYSTNHRGTWDVRFRRPGDDREVKLLFLGTELRAAQRRGKLLDIIAPRIEAALFDKEAS
ncbi:MAG: hypothetical protein ACE5H8_16050 [Alphaproteobacteria bacterium]